MRIGELARSSGVSIDTLRYYERIGLLPRVRRSDNGYREYPAEAQNRIRVIRNAVDLGFPLKEIARVLRIRDAGGSPCRQVRDYAVTLVDQLEQRIKELKTEKRAMIEIIERWNDRLANARDGERLHLLETPNKTVTPKTLDPRVKSRV